MEPQEPQSLEQQEQQRLLQDIYDFAWEETALQPEYGMQTFYDPFVPLSPRQLQGWPEGQSSSAAAHVSPATALDEAAVPSEPWFSMSSKSVNPRKPRKPRKARARGLRRQNHSCDQCRTAKRACDLLPDGPVPKGTCLAAQACSTCKVRGLECTIMWLARRKASEGQSGAAPGPLTEADATEPVMAPAIAIESELALQVVMRDTRDALFQLYIDIFDKPLSQCILPGSMPPRHQLGIAALLPLSKSAFISAPFNTASQWIRSCDRAAQGDSCRGSKDTIPHIFHALSLLDALFQQQPRWRVSESRNTAITEAYRWIAVACAAQFSSAAATQARQAIDLDLLLASFRRARDLIFDSMAAVTSFRLAFSMLLLGCISLPGTGQETQNLQHDARYALGEGMRRLRLLCSRAKDMLQGPDAGGASPHQKLTLSPGTSQLVMELIAGVDWLTDIMIATIISSSRTINLPSSASLQLETTLSQHYNSIQSEDVNLTLMLSGGKNQEEAENGILARATTQTKSFISLWEAAMPKDFINVGDADGDGSILAGARHVTSTAVLLWKALASLTVATEAGVTTNKECAEVERLYEKMGRLIKLWRKCFGRFDLNTELNLRKAPSDVRHVFKVCSNDSDLAILLFCDLVDNLENTLAVDAGGMLPSQQRHLLGTLRADRLRRNEQQLISAVQVAAFSPINMANNQFDGTAAAPQCSAFAQNAGMYPWPRLMVQAYMLAINKLKKELGNSVMPSRYAVSMASGLQSCVQSLQMLRESLATYSNVTNAITQKSPQEKPPQEKPLQA